MCALLTGFVLQVLIAVSVTLLVNWAHFMDWALSNGHEMALAAEAIAGRGHRCELAAVLRNAPLSQMLRVSPLSSGHA